MLRRLLLGQPRRDEKEVKEEICEEEKRAADDLTKNSTANNVEEKSQAKEDLSDSDSETESSEAEDSDLESLDNSFGTDSLDECFGDVLEWKGFEMVRDKRVHTSTPNDTQVRNGKTVDREEMTGNDGNTKQNQNNPFADAFESQENEMSQNHDEFKNKVNNESNDDEKSSRKNSQGRKVKNDENDNRENNAKVQNNNKQIQQTNEKNTETTPSNITSTNDVTKTKIATKPTVNTKINYQKPLNKYQPKTNREQTKYDDNQSKTTLQSPKASTTNHTLPKTNANGISRHNSFRGNQHTANIKRQTSCRSTPGKDPKVQRAQSSMPATRRTSVDTKWHQGIKNNTTALKGDRINGKGKQGNGNPSNVSVNDLEKILGVNVAELREVITKFKSEKMGTTVDGVGQSDVVQSDLGSPGMIGQDACKKDAIKQCKSETIDNKDEISSDSGVSEPDVHSTDGQPRYVPLKAIIKRKEYLEGQIRKLQDRMVVMEDNKKDIQFVHDLFDLYSDGLEKVERSNGGVACVLSLKSILACQLREMDEEDFKAKLKVLEDLGIPHFSEISTRIEKLRKRIRHTLNDDRKCRSKGVQKMRFEIGKVQGMCEAVLDCVYHE